MDRLVPRKGPPPPPHPGLRRAGIAFGIAALLLFGAACLYTTRRTLSHCEICYSAHSEGTAGFGTDPYHPWWQFSSTEEFRPSSTYEDFFGGSCRHRWGHFSTNISRFFFMGMSVGGVRKQPLAWDYEDGPRFRGLVQQRLKARTLTKPDFRAACEIPGEPTEADLKDPEKRRLLALGVDLLSHGNQAKDAEVWEKALVATRPK